MTTARYVLNPAVMRLTWNPEAWQVVRFMNPNYANSLWLGTVWNIALLPTRLWQEVARPALAGHIRLACQMASRIVTTTLETAGWGLMGRARPLPVSAALLCDADILSEQQARAMLEAGKFDAVMEYVERRL